MGQVRLAISQWPKVDLRAAKWLFKKVWEYIKDILLIYQLRKKGEEVEGRRMP